MIPATIAAVALVAAAPQEAISPVTNPVGYFEIPVADLDRAIRFYETVFGHALERTMVDGYPMALFPAREGGAGASGALAKGDVYIPGKAGPVLYFSVASIDETLVRARRAGGAVLYPKKSIGSLGWVAEVEDSEGNRIALHQARGDPQPAR